MLAHLAGAQPRSGRTARSAPGTLREHELTTGDDLGRLGDQHFDVVRARVAIACADEQEQVRLTQTGPRPRAWRLVGLVDHMVKVALCLGQPTRKIAPAGITWPATRCTVAERSVRFGGVHEHRATVSP